MTKWRPALFIAAGLSLVVHLALAYWVLQPLWASAFDEEQVKISLLVDISYGSAINQSEAEQKKQANEPKLAIPQKEPVLIPAADDIVGYKDSDQHSENRSKVATQPERRIEPLAPLSEPNKAGLSALEPQPQLRLPQPQRKQPQIKAEKSQPKPEEPQLKPEEPQLKPIKTAELKIGDPHSHDQGIAKRDHYETTIPTGPQPFPAQAAAADPDSIYKASSQLASKTKQPKPTPMDQTDSKVGIATKSSPSLRYQVGAPYTPKPEYPSIAVRRRWQGEVLIAMLVQADGTPAKVTVKKGSGYPILDKSALKQLSSWRLAPSAKELETIYIPIIFRL